MVYVFTCRLLFLCQGLRIFHSADRKCSFQIFHEILWDHLKIWTFHCQFQRAGRLPAHTLLFQFHGTFREILAPHFKDCTTYWEQSCLMPCWLSADKQSLHHRWIWGIHCTQAIKHSSKGCTLDLEPSADITRRSKHIRSGNAILRTDLIFEN